MTNGIDVSYAQGDISWDAVSTDFAVIRAGYGRLASQKDEKFDRNYDGCKRNGIPCGVYWYSYADSPSDAEKEADACLSVIKGKKLEYPVYYDFENLNSHNMEDSGRIIRAFLERVEKNGWWVGIYSNVYVMNNYIPEDIRKRYAVWIAQYGADTPDYSGSYGMWQYTNEGRKSGISGNVDLDRCYVDYPTQVKAAGLNGYGKPEKILDKSGYKKGDDTIGCLAMKELIRLARIVGLHDIGTDENGIFGDGTLKAVNYLLGRWGYEQNGIAGENFIKRIYEEIAKKL